MSVCVTERPQIGQCTERTQDANVSRQQTDLSQKAYLLLRVNARKTSVPDPWFVFCSTPKHEQESASTLAR